MTGLKVKKNYHHSYWCKCLGTLARPGWTYSVTLDLYGSSLYSLTIPNLWCFNAPVTQANRAEVMITLAVPSWRQDFKPKYAPIATGWLLRHVWLLNMCINVLHSNLWLPAQAGERPWRSETIGVAARKMSEYFCARRHPQVGFLVRFGFTTKWISWNWSRKVVFDFSNCSGAPRSLFLVYKLGLKKWLKRAFENHFDEKNKINPVLTNFQHLFCSEKAYPRPGTL